MPLPLPPPPPLRACCQVAPAEVPVLRQNRPLWERTKRENGLPADAVGWVNWKDGVIVVLMNHPEERATVVHERAHIEYQGTWDVVDREEWEKAWQGWRLRLPWRPAQDRASEAAAYLIEWLSPESRYTGQVPIEAVRLLLKIRGRER